MRTPPERIPDLLRQACADRPERSAVEALVFVCRDIAEAYLRVRQVGFDVSSRLDGSHDLALDFVADLFRRDDEGRFVELRAYFSRIPESPELCFSRLRRLVFSAVAEGLFDHHRSHDPGLARIIRNVKIAALRKGIVMEDRHGARWMLFGPDDRSLPTVVPELLEGSITGHVREGVSVDRLLDAIADVLRFHEVYRPAITVVAAARVIRSAWTRVQADESAAWAYDVSGDGSRPFVDAAAAHLRAHLHGSYVRSGKMSDDLFGVYVDVVVVFLENGISDECDAGQSLYGLLSAAIPGLTRAEYIERHRARIEYMARCGRDALVKSARIELGLSANEADCKE